MLEILRKSAFLGALLILLTSASSKAQGTFGPIRLSVDATQAPQKILHAHMQIPVQ